MREKIVLDKADLLSVCEAVIDRRGLTTHNGIDSRWNRETELLWRFCDALSETRAAPSRWGS